MNVKSRPNITSTSKGHQDRRLPSRVPRRDEIDAADVEVIKRGTASKADLYVVDVGEGPMVVKDFAHKPGWARLLGRYLIRREIAAYRWLGDTPTVPRVIGRIDAHALALEKIDGVPLVPAASFRPEGDELVPRLRALVDGLHRRGLAHLDLNRENLMRRSNGELAAVDLAGAVWCRPGGIVHRLVFGLFRNVDEASFLKWKERLTPGCLTADEQRFYDRHRFRRRFWIFNRKAGGDEGG